MWRDYIREVTPYTPGEQPGGNNIIKLNTNENPYPPCDGVRDALKNYDYEALRRYPDPAIGELRSAIASYHNLDMENVFVGVGSDDVIAMCYMTFFNSDKPIVFPDITYSFYDVWADEFKVPYTTLALNEEFRINREDYYVDNGGVIIPNPNAPTGIAESVEFFEDIIVHNKNSIVIIDEAYVDFGATSCIELLSKYDNLIVVRTFSKSRSMAGSRIGYALASKEIITALHNVKYSYNSYTMDSVTIKLGVEAIKDEKYFRDNLDKVMCTRNWTCDKLEELGFEVFDSSANFLFVKPSEITAKELFEKLKERNIYVRYFNKPRIDNYLRISIGTDSEMQALIDAIAEII